jgi:type II secretory pathway predicted ATPase ExeA
VGGSAGSGKTYTTYEALARVDCHLVRSLCGDRHHFRATQIDSAIYQDLTSEMPRQGREARRRQLERVCGEMSRERDIVVLLDEATGIPRQVFTEIKFLRDALRYGSDPQNPRRPDRRPLFAVVMIGWPSLAMDIEKSNELRPRIRRKMMGGMARSEVARFIEHLGLAGVVEKDVAGLIADHVRYPLHIMDRLREGMERAWARGDKRLRVDDVSLDVTEMYRLVKRAGLRLKDIADTTGVSVASVHNVVNGGTSSERTREAVQKAIQSKLDQLREATPARDDVAKAG